MPLMVVSDLMVGSDPFCEVVSDLPTILHCCKILNSLYKGFDTRAGVR